MHADEAQYPAGPMPRAVLADDHALLLEAFCLLLAKEVEVVGTARSGAELIRLALLHTPELVITDLSMPDGSGLDAARVIRVQLPATRIIVLSVHEDPALVAAALEAGASGYVVKSAGATDLRTAVAAVMQGERWISPAVRAHQDLLRRAGTPQRLSERERDVARGLIAGESAKQSAARIGITERTVVFHRQRLRARFAVRTTAELIQRLLASEHLA